MSDLAFYQAHAKSVTAAIAATTSTKMKAAWQVDLDATNTRIAELAAAPAPAPAPTPVPTPAVGLGFTLGVNVGNDSGDPAGSTIESRTDSYAAWVGSRLTIAHQFANPDFIGVGKFYWGGAWTTAMLARWGTWKAAKAGRRMLFTIAPGYAAANVGMNTATQHALTDESGFTSVLSGAEDSQLQAMAHLLVQYGLGDSILRVFHEPPWYCWGIEGAHGAQPYRDAIHHVSTVVKAIAPNLMIAPSWDPGLAGRHDHLDDPAGYDAICVDYYCGDGNLVGIKADAGNLAAFATSVKKPVVVSEWGLWHPARVTDTDAVGFFQFMVGWAKTLGAPLVYFEDNPPDADKDHRLWTGTPYDPTIVNGFLAAVRA